MAPPPELHAPREAVEANAAVFHATRQLRSDLCELLPGLPEAAAQARTPPLPACMPGRDVGHLPSQAVRDGLGGFNPICAKLANPATPFPEALREQATTMYKQLLRREMIDAEAVG